MKSLALLIILGTLISCQEVERTRRRGSCVNDKGEAVQCAFSEALGTGYTAMAIADVTVPVVISSRTIVLHGTEIDTQYVQDYKCEMDVGAGTIFNYTIKNSVLTLRTGLSSMVYKKTSGLSNDTLVGTWEMVETSKSDQVTTELIFVSDEELRLQKTCKVK